MNLHEIYKTLMRRGMPDVRRLNDGGELYGLEDNHIGGWGYWDGENYGAVNMHESDARDLITMHALRWVKTLPAMRVVCQRWQAGWNIFVALDDDYWDGHKPRPDSDKFTGDTILAAILAATAHLEPKGDDDAKRP